MLPTTLVLALVGFAGLVTGDTPANCTFEDVRGFWVFEESQPIGDRTEDCSKMPTVARKVYFKLDYPNVAVDPVGNVGHWTMIYNQGFEVIINYRKYFAFSKYEQQGKKVVSYCHQTQPGWAHDVHGNNWACFQAHKVDNWDPTHKIVVGSKVQETRPLLQDLIDVKQALSESYVNAINENQQNSWKAFVYPDLQLLDKEDLIRMEGGRNSRLVNRPKSKEATAEIRRLVNQLPESWDWRNVNGVNYLPPVRNQGKCGSCYIFASMETLEARIRIQTNNTQKPIFSVQSVLDCSHYSQGCEGGFPYLIAGKHAQDFGVIGEECNPYSGKRAECYQNKSSTCQQKYFTFDYHYIGGYYGGCSEEAMMLELVHNGPIAVGFEVYPDFRAYKSGVYEHKAKHLELLGVDVKGDFNPFDVTNHEVMLVGYGKDPASGMKYWIVQNSWGEKWGMDGFFWIRRGTDECGIESLAVSITPMPV